MLWIRKLENPKKYPKTPEYPNGTGCAKNRIYRG
jgi:hypothetical protein